MWPCGSKVEIPIQFRRPAPGSYLWGCRLRPQIRRPTMVHTDVSWTKDDLYMRLKDLKRQMEFSDIQEEYIKDETRTFFVVKA